MSNSRRAALAALAVALVGALALGGWPPVPAPPPIAPGPPQTVIVVIACTLRADRLGLYGNTAPTTPYLDRLGQEGVVFDTFYANAPWTRPAVAALTTGRYPLASGVDDPRPILGSTRGVAPDFETIAERFSVAGWSTVGATANPNANAYFGMDQGFDKYVEATGLWREDRRKVLGPALVEAWADEARIREGRLYGQLVIVDTHGPRSPGLVDRFRLNPLRMLSRDPLFVYDAAVHAFDSTVQALDAALAAMGRADRLLVVVGDHGEGLDTPAHAGEVHGRYLFDPTVHVPFVLHGAGLAGPRRVSGLSEGVDLLPTVLELAGLKAEGPLDGQSRAAAARGEREGTGEDHVYVETYFSTEHKIRWSTPEWTLIHSEATRISPGEDMLFAADDRDQWHDVAQTHPALTRSMLDAVLAFRQPILAGQVVWQADGDDVTVKRQLRELGYVE